MVTSKLHQHWVYGHCEHETNSTCLSCSPRPWETPEYLLSELYSHRQLQLWWYVSLHKGRLNSDTRLPPLVCLLRGSLIMVMISHLSHRSIQTAGTMVLTSSLTCDIGAFKPSKWALISSSHNRTSYYKHLFSHMNYVQHVKNKFPFHISL